MTKTANESPTAVTQGISPFPAVMQGIPAPVKRPIEIDPEDDDIKALDDLLFGEKAAFDEDRNRVVGALNATESQDVLVFDYCHWGPVNVLVMKLEGRGLYFLQHTSKRTAEPVIK